MMEWSRSWEHWYRRVLPAYWIFLFCATHFPRPRLPGPIPEADKLVHFVAFGLLAFLFWRFVWIAFLTLGIYATVDEYLQQFVNRQTSWLDGLANVAGIVLVLIALEARRRLRRASAATGPGHAEP
jgi:VanZ family protein